MGEVNYNPSMESDIIELLPDDMVETDANTDKISNWENQLKFNLSLEAERVLLEYPEFGTLFTRKFILALTNEAKRFVQEFLIRIQSRIETTRETAISTILSDRYPLDIRIKMLDFFDKQEYYRISELSLEFDAKSRERPNKGKQGPKIPLEVGEEFHHIDWEKIPI